ncbi:ATPase [Betaproteobacteria bacterium]|nr:ATPase [Betaproteobacteria bacterium]
MYIHRHIEPTMEKTRKMFGAVCVTGARQTGKSTLVEKCYPEVSAITLDDVRLRESAINEPATFIDNMELPVFIDEVQRAPVIFHYIKMHIDKHKKKGDFLMSGPQKFHLMKNVSESLTGRVGVLELYGLSLREIEGDSFRENFIPTKAYMTARNSAHLQISQKSLWHRIWRGSYPELVTTPDYDWEIFYRAYVATYLERDVRELAQVGDEMKFYQFMQACAAMTGQLLNLAGLARDIGVSTSTAERWISVLKASGIIHLLRPYHNNLLKRAVKTPKLYFLDTGLACYLTRWENEDVLKVGAMSGAIFETFVIAEILKSYANNGNDADVYFYRDKEKQEIDLIIHKNGALYPIEIKKHADVNKSDIKAFTILDEIPGVIRGEGCVVCAGNESYPLSERDRAVGIGWV